ncbi:hypothetical protein QJS66_00425 [Kocuria rhizophila]|nr:hypothetical protein QJS66_00425 [Kocuria rhizophila]
MSALHGYGLWATYEQGGELMARGFKRTRKGIVGRFVRPEARSAAEAVGRGRCSRPSRATRTTPGGARGLGRGRGLSPRPRAAPAAPASSAPEQAAELRRLTDRSLRERRIDRGLARPGAHRGADHGTGAGRHAHQPCRLVLASRLGSTPAGC